MPNSNICPGTVRVVVLFLDFGCAWIHQEIISWFVMRDQGDRRAFTIVERYKGESVCGPLFLSCLLFTLHKYLHLVIYTKVTLLYTQIDALTILAIYLQSQKYHLEVCLTFTVAVSDWSFRGPA